MALGRKRLITQIMPDATDDTKSAMPCATRWGDMATIARTNVAMKKMNPNPKIQNVRNPRARHIQPALTADDLPVAGLEALAVAESG